MLMNKILRFSLVALMAIAFGNVYADEVTMKYTGTENANITGENSAALVGLDASAWSVVGDKGKQTNFPGLIYNANGNQIRLYWNAEGSNTITVSSLAGATINSIKFTFIEGYENVSVTVGGNLVSATDGTYAINSSSFILGNANTSSKQVRFTELVINYTPAGGGGSEGGKFTYTLATVDGAVADFSNPTDSKGRLFAKVNKDPIVIKAVAGKLPANADGGAQQMTPDKTKPIEGRENTYAVKSVEAWSDASFNTNNKFTDWNSIDPKYNMYYLSGTGNPYTMLYAQEIMKTEGEKIVPTDTYKADYDYYTPDGGKLPTTGMYFKLTPKANGTLKLGIFANKGDRKTFLVEESSKATVAYTAEGYVANRKYPDGHEKAGKMMYLTNEEIQAIATEDGSSEYVIGSKNAHFYGFITATVEKGKSYYLFLHNGQMGLSSVEFNYDEASLDKAIDETDEIANTPDPTDPSSYTGITSIKNDAINSNAQMYNLSGQKVDKSYKGIVIQNGRKFVNK